MTMDRAHPILTVAIPTYNRNEILRKNLEHLLPQLTPECELLIIDNCSDVPVEETLKDILGHYPSVRMRLVRNRANIGGNANIVRCFEYCETEWMWLLGDDDEPLSDSVSVIFRSIGLYPDAVFMNFAALEESKKRECERTSYGLVEFVRSIDSFGDVLFISSGVYRVHRLKHRINVGYQFAYSCAPHIAMLIVSLGVDGQCLFSKRTLVHWRAIGVDQHFSSIPVALGLGALLELPMPSSTRMDLARKIDTVFVHWLSLRNICGQMLLMSPSDSGLGDAFVYQRILSWALYYDRALRAGRWIESSLYLCILRYRVVSKPVAAMLYALIRKRRFGTTQHPNYYARM